MENFSVSLNGSYPEDSNFNITTANDEEEEIRTLISIVKSILCITCLSAVIVNLKVFACIYWMRRPLNSVLKISLSLALADCCASCLSAVIIFFEYVISRRTYVIMEIVRLSFILVTVFHLLGLGFNHYIGIRKPLLHNSRLTQKGITGLLALLWVIPSIYILTLYTMEGGSSFWKALVQDDLVKIYLASTPKLFINQTSNGTNVDSNLSNSTETVEKNHMKFVETFRFRMAFGSFVLISMLLIVICYIWILIIIKKQHRLWKELSRTGCTVWRGSSIRKISRERSHCNEQSKIKRNLKAVYTTLIILGSCFVGWMPALLLFVLTCSQDCFISGELLASFNEDFPKYIIMVRFFDNEMLFLKMIANPIIYSTRMKEIKDGTKRMHQVLLNYFRRKTCNTSDKYKRQSKFPYKNNDSVHSHMSMSHLRSVRNHNHDSKRKRVDNAVRDGETSFL